MKNKVLKSIFAIMLIIVMTMSDLALIVSYAVEAINTATNHENVEFSAYFKNEKGETVIANDYAINAEDMKLYLEVSVKKDGYFDGVITLKESNFNIKQQENLNSDVEKIEGNVIYLKQINAGKKAEIVLDIEPVIAEEYNLNLLNMQSKLEISGTYKDGTEKNIEIKAENSVNVNFLAPSELSMDLTSKVITNTKRNIEGTTKRIVQVEITSSNSAKTYPIKSTEIQMDTVSNVEKVQVITKGTKATNGMREQVLDEKSYTYNKETNQLNIKLENKDTDGKVSWIKNGQDRILVTFILDENAEISEDELKLKSIITFYGSEGKILENETNYKVSEPKYGIVTGYIQNEEKYMYKGKIYAGQEREYNTTAQIEINHDGLAQKIEANQTTVYETEKAQEKAANVEFKTTTISKAEFDKILGTDGKLIIKDSENNLIREITSKTEADENGNITVEYNLGIKSINIETTAPIGLGIIRLHHVKAIKENSSRDEIKTFKFLKEKLTTKHYYSEESIEQTVEHSFTRRMSLLETKTAVKLELSKNLLSTATINEDVKMGITLRTDNEMYDLYKNPEITIKLPESVKNVKLKEANKLQLDNFTVAKFDYLPEGKGIKLLLTGEQTEYTSSNTQGYIEIIADIELEETTPSKEDKITFTYTNQNVIQYENEGKIEKTVQISAPAGLVAFNSITSEEINIKTNSVLSKEQQIAEIEVNEDAKEVTVKSILVNNKEEAISNVVLFGNLPVKGSMQIRDNKIENTIDSKLKNKISVSSESAKIYYTSNSEATEDLEKAENGWNEELENVQNPVLYMVKIPKIEQKEKIELSYTVNVPEKLEYNQDLKTTYNVNYIDSQGTKLVQAIPVGLTTGKGAHIEAKLEATVGNQDVKNGETVKAGEVITYRISVTNDGNATAKDLTIKALVPEGTTYVKPMKDFEYAEPISKYYDEYTDKKEEEVKIETLEEGKTYVVEYQVRVNKDVKENKEILNKATVTYDNNIEATSNEVKNILTKGDIRVTVKRRTDVDTLLAPGDSAQYYLIVENISNTELKNINVQIKSSEELGFSKVEEELGTVELEAENISNSEINKNSIKINSILPGEASVYLAYFNVEKIIEAKKDAQVFAVATEGNNTYKSNLYKDVVYGFDVKMEMSASRENEYLKVGDVIEYQIKIDMNSEISSSSYTVETNIPKQLTIQKIENDGNEIEKLDENYFTKIVTSSTTIKIYAIVNYDYNRTEIEKISTFARLTYKGEDEIVTPEIIHNLEAIEIDVPEIPDDPMQPIKPDNPDNPDNPDEPGTPPEEQEKKKYNINGKAWVDQNKDGELNEGDKDLKDITVKLLNVETNEFVRNEEKTKDITAKTGKDGYYNFENIPEGNYIVVFEYDTALYKPTTYKKEGIEESKNSNVVAKTLTINKEEKQYAVTDEIKLNGNIANLNLGLVFVKQFDIDLDKYISKVIVQNSTGTTTYDYENKDFVKVEIPPKHIVGTTLIVQYTIKATNIGDVDAYVNSIVDYAPTGLKFSSELNKDWYEAEGNLYTTSLENIAIAPGESKEVTLTLTKTKADGDAELINNMAEIDEAYNIYGIADTNSKETNKNKDENDLGSADLMISLQTGTVFNYITLVISMIAIIGVAVYLINKKVLNGKF